MGKCHIVLGLGSSRQHQSAGNIIKIIKRKNLAEVCILVAEQVRRVLWPDCVRVPFRQHQSAGGYHKIHQKRKIIIIIPCHIPGQRPLHDGYRRDIRFYFLLFIFIFFRCNIANQTFCFFGCFKMKVRRLFTIDNEMWLDGFKIQSKLKNGEKSFRTPILIILKCSFV